MSAIIRSMRSVIISIAFILFLISGCTKENATPTEIGLTLQTSTIENIGSDTLVNLALAWAETYHEQNIDVEITVTGGGSGTGIAALINGSVDIANASRPIKQEEIQEALNNGVTPKEFIVARDAIAIIVNPNNPISQLSIQQLSDIYSGKINNWSEIGGDDREIVRLSRETNSGTHVFFLENVIRMGNKDDNTLFSTDTLLLPSSEGIISEVRDNPNAIGYDGLGYVTSDVKVIAVASETSEIFILPSAVSVNNGEYPIARDLYMYTNGQPAGVINDYINWIKSPEAQSIVSELGFVPISHR